MSKKAKAWEQVHSTLREKYEAVRQGAGDLASFVGAEYTKAADFYAYIQLRLRAEKSRAERGNADPRVLAELESLHASAGAAVSTLREVLDKLQEAFPYLIIAPRAADPQRGEQMYLRDFVQEGADLDPYEDSWTHEVETDILYGVD